MRVKGVVLWGILCVNFADHHSMGKMNFTRICLLNIIPAIYAKGKQAICYIERQSYALIAMKTSNVHDFYSAECRQHPGHYEYYKNYDDLEARCLFFFFPSFSNKFVKSTLHCCF